MKTQLVDQSDVTTMTHSHEEVSFDCDEQSLVDDAKCGSLAAFDQLVERYQARVFRLAQSIARNREDAEEVMQNAFVQAFKNLTHFRGDSRFYTWLVRITINEGLMIVRRRRVNEISIEDGSETDNGSLRGELRDWGPNPEQCCSRVELRKMLVNAIDELPAKCRVVFQLRDVEGFSTEETARALDLSLPATKTRLLRARLQLRESLNKFLRPMVGRQFQERIPSARQF